ncbi:helix-turn-helix domain-containing protein [Burkholderia pseudomallei]|uniref:helix-turn-helix domain-containing protein n=1 Tax=Burkholderia pseudomallei TaxID=28450 RepID=UPI0003FE4086|nr:helix-turn-helix domain-containing protein [Burkholderia pseudomallei]AIP19983.1 helix-turn-helix family protein [Burkholderia pseudomallei MSHR5855]AIP42340.1 helix-turn-helix family protein [Burkholderia pseudomallei MSHR5848]
MTKTSIHFNDLGNVRYTVTYADNVSTWQTLRGSTDAPMLLSYNDLIAQHKQLLLANHADSKSHEQIFKNHLSTLVSYLAYNGKTPDSQVGVEMLAKFEERSRAYLEQLQVEHRTMLDRRSHLRAWQEAVSDIKKAAEAPAKPSNPKNDNVNAFLQALRNAFSAQEETPKSLAKKAGVSPSAIARWLKGAMPKQSNLPSLTRIERALGLKRDALRNLLLESRTQEATEVRNSKDISYRARHKSRTKQAYALKEAELTAPMLREWRQFFEYKTEVYTQLRRERRSTWRMLPISKVASNLSNAAQRHGMGCVTADLTFQQVRQFLGFLCLPESKGGMGLRKADVMTLAWLAVPKAVNSYLEFITRRSAGIIHRGQKNFASFTASLTSKDNGYLTQQPSFAKRLPAEFMTDSFEALCEKTHLLARAWKDKANGQSRKPDEPIRGLLILPDPLAPVFRAINALDDEAAAAAPGSIDEAVRKRDALLMSMMIANPLRRRNFILMTYEEDGSGNLYHRHDGWRLRFEADDFKNERGAAHSNYDAPLPSELSDRIEEYLEEYRPRLLKSNPNASWAFPGRNGLMWKNLSKQVEKTTKRLIPETPGFGPHALRHLVPTVYLREHPNDFPTVAQLLHDRLETVMAVYAHLRQDDSFGRWQEHLRKVPRK